MDKLELKKLTSELKRVDAAKEEMEYRIEERLVEIQRLKDNIIIQEQKIKELQEKLKLT